MDVCRLDRLKFSKDPNIIAFTIVGCLIVLFNIKENKIIQKFIDNSLLEEMIDRNIPLSHYSNIERLFFSKDGKRLISHEYLKIVKIWDIESGKLIHKVKYDLEKMTVFEIDNSSNLIDDSKLNWDNLYVNNYSEEFIRYNYISLTSKYLLNKTETCTYDLINYKTKKKIYTFTILYILNMVEWINNDKYLIFRTSDELVIFDINAKKVIFSSADLKYKEYGAYTRLCYVIRSSAIEYRNGVPHLIYIGGSTNLIKYELKSKISYYLLNSSDFISHSDNIDDTDFIYDSESYCDEVRLLQLSCDGKILASRSKLGLQFWDTKTREVVNEFKNITLL